MDEKPKAARRGRQRSGGGVTVVRALTRGLDVLDALARKKEATLTEISESVALPASTAYRILETLASRGYAHYIEDRSCYRLGIRAFETGYAFVSQTHLIEAANPAMLGLAEASGESVNLAVLDGREVVYIHQIEGKGMMRLFTRVGARAPVHCTGVGKCLLAWMQPDQATVHLPEDPFDCFTPYTIKSRDAFFKVLKKVRAEGFAIDDEEREEGVSCVTAPIFDARGTVVAALSLSGPSTRIERRGIPGLSKLVIAAANTSSSALN